MYSGKTRFSQTCQIRGRQEPVHHMHMHKSGSSLFEGDAKSGL